MTKRVLGGDGIVRMAAGPAPDWRPAPPGALRGLRAEAKAATAAALSAGDPGLATRALALRAELRVVETVRGYTPPVLDPSGPMPFGPARGGLDHVEIDDIVFDPKTGQDRVARQMVRKRRGPSALSGLPGPLRRTAEAYADLVAAVASSPGPGLEGPRGGGISDGGATSRCALVQRLDRARMAIGTAVVLSPRGAAAHRDRARTSVTARDIVDRICIQGWTVDQVLASRGWSRRQQYRDACQSALREALQRLAAVT